MSSISFMSNGRILLVDDEDMFLASTAELLRNEQYICDKAVDARTATDMVRAHTYDVVIADINMPGNTELQWVRSLEQQRLGVPVILMTGYPSLETAIDSVQLDVLAYLVKPVDVQELLQHVRRGVARRQTRALVHRMQRRARERAQNFDRLSAHLEGDTGESASLLEPLFEVMFERIIDGYLDLRQLVTIMERRDPEMLNVGLRMDPDKQRLLDALGHAVEVIKETKSAFKSKRLAALRRQLESTLRRTVSERRRSRRSLD